MPQTRKKNKDASNKSENLVGVGGKQSTVVGRLKNSLVNTNWREKRGNASGGGKGEGGVARRTDIPTREARGGFWGIKRKSPEKDIGERKKKCPKKKGQRDFIRAKVHTIVGKKSPSDGRGRKKKKRGKKEV